MSSSDLEGHALSWPCAQVLTDATAARPSNTIWLRPKAALGTDGMQSPVLKFQHAGGGSGDEVALVRDQHHRLG